MEGLGDVCACVCRFPQTTCAFGWGGARTFRQCLKEAMTQKSCSSLSITMCQAQSYDIEPVIPILRMTKQTFSLLSLPSCGPRVCHCLASLAHEMICEVLGLHTGPNTFPPLSLFITVQNFCSGQTDTLPLCRPALCSRPLPPPSSPRAFHSKVPVQSDRPLNQSASSTTIWADINFGINP